MRLGLAQRQIHVAAVLQAGSLQRELAQTLDAERKANDAYHGKAKAPDGSKIRQDGAAAFRRCFAEHAPKDKGFDDVLRQAQSIADALPAK